MLRVGWTCHFAAHSRCKYRVAQCQCRSAPPDSARELLQLHPAAEPGRYLRPTRVESGPFGQAQSRFRLAKRVAPDTNQRDSPVRWAMKFAVEDLNRGDQME